MAGMLLLLGAELQAVGRAPAGALLMIGAAIVVGDRDRADPQVADDAADDELHRAGRW